MRDVTAVILTEAGSSIGLGHLVRCVALYDALAAEGVECRLIVAGEAPRHVIGDRDAAVRDWADDGAGTLASGTDIAVVDSYRAKCATYDTIAQNAGVSLYFDDTARLRYPPGIVLNGNPAAEDLYRNRDSDHRFLLGTRYQVLRQEFWRCEPRQVSPVIENVLVVSGGTDTAGARAALASAARDALPHACIDVVDTPRTAAEMRVAMRSADVALSAAGQTLYELAACGTPTVAVCTAENQRPQALGFARAGAVRLAGAWGDDGVLARVRAELLELAGVHERAAMSAAGQALVDGRGALRVARACVSAAVARRMTITPAVMADADDLLSLANDPGVRAMSFTSASIAPATHHDWMVRTLADPDRMLLVARDGGRLVGQVRFDVADAEAVVSISVSSGYRGRGLGAALLLRAIDTLAAARPHVRSIVALIKRENQASARTFESAGFKPMESDPGDPAGSLRCSMQTKGPRSGERDG